MLYPGDIWTSDDGLYPSDAGLPLVDLPSMLMLATNTTELELDG